MALNSLNSAASPALRPLPPRTRGLPLLGALPNFLRRPFDFLLDARARYGDIYTLDLGVTEAIVLNHPRHIQHVFVDNAKNYYKGGGLWEGVRAVSGNGLVVSEGDFWLRQRRLMQPHFHRKRLAALTQAMVEATAESLDECEAGAGRPFDVLPAFAKITMRVICRALFGQELSRADLDATREHATYIFDYLIVTVLTSELPRWLPVPARAGCDRRSRSWMPACIASSPTSVPPPRLPTACLACWWSWSTRRPARA
jgi:cytochrome P450